MIVLTAGDHRVGTDSTGQIEAQAASFPAMIRASQAQAARLGYRFVAYDLGGLGFGEPLTVDDESFRAHGYYRKLSDTFYSKALHKPEIVRRTLAASAEPVVYLDGDALLWDRVDEVAGDHDLAVTVRSRREIKLMADFAQANPDAVRLINAGVIFFAPTAATKDFVGRWAEATAELGSDQLALNQLVGPTDRAVVGQTLTVAGVRVRYLDGGIYNYSPYGQAALGDGVKVLHFKGGCRARFREFFPTFAE